MIECPNGDVRDLLPDLVHERLDAAERNRVEAHVADCEACTSEVRLLERIRASAERYGGVPVNVERVVGALPRRGRIGRTGHRWSRSVGLRIAAGIMVLVAGAGWWQSSRRSTRVEGVRDPAPVVSQASPAPGGAAHQPAVAGQRPRQTAPPPAVVATRAISLDDDLTDLSDRELQSLLGALDSFEAVTRVEPAALVPIIDAESR